MIIIVITPLEVMPYPDANAITKILSEVVEW